jgi:hypothetical protein
MMPLDSFSDKDAPLGDDEEDHNWKGSAQNKAAWICNWPEDNVRLWMHRMPVSEGPSLGPPPLPDHLCSSGLTKLVSLACRWPCADDASL